MRFIALLIAAAIPLIMSLAARAQEAGREAPPTATVEAPAPVPTLPSTMTFRQQTMIPVPKILEVDNTVFCRLDGETLRCTAVKVPVVELPADSAAASGIEDEGADE